MGPAALAATVDRPNNPFIPVLEMTPLLDEIASLIEAPTVDRTHVERTLTDGYAHALELETERSRLEKQVDRVTHGLRRDPTEKARELEALTRKLDGTAGDLVRLRARLAELRRRV